MDEFNEAMFKTKVDNIFVKLFTSIMKGNLDDVKHFINSNVESKYQAYIDTLTKNNERQMYDELNVKNTKILNRKEVEDKEVVEVEIISRYMDYVIDMDTGETIKGDDTRRIEKRNILVFEKNNNTKDIKLVRKCPGCGASISVNTNGKCEYCGIIYNLEDYDYILTDIQTF